MAREQASGKMRQHLPRKACSAICTATCFEIMLQLSTQSGEQSVTISALTGDALKRILGLLDAKDLSSASQVRRAHKVTCTVVSTLDADLHGTSEMASSATLRDAGVDDAIWQALVMDDNRASAWPVIDLAANGVCCSWRYNRPRRFYQCRLMSLQLDRITGTLRLCFNARGDSDLRHPTTSQMALVVDRPDSNYNPGGMMQPDHADQIRIYNFSHSSSYYSCASTPGHHKGGLECTGDFFCDSETFAEDTALVFCYANHVAQHPLQYFEADYLSAALLRVPAGVQVQDAFLAQSKLFQLPGEPEQRLAGQTPAEEQAMWHSLPAEVQARWF